MQALVDNFQRRFRYLRLSIIDACNFRCSYCLPQGHCHDSQLDKPLHLEEIYHLTSAFAGLGVEKVRITGGEPTLRRDILEVFSTIRAIPGIQQLALSTNGYRLAQLAPKLRDHGCTAVNVSLDSLDPKRFTDVTGMSSHSAVREGIDAALAEGLKVKINAVLLRGVNDHELPLFLDFVKERDCTVRFIELMRTADNKNYFEQHHMRAEALSAWIEAEAWQKLPRSPIAGPADEYRHADFKGRIGFITPYANNFCGQCNRLRVSCRGELKLCLFGDGKTSLRHLLRSAGQKHELQQYIGELLGHKKSSHALHQNQVGATPHLASIGG